MTTTILQSFVIGSSILVAIPHLYTVGFLKPEIFSFDFNSYCLLAPIYFGIMNALSNWGGRLNHWTLHQRLWWISLISIGFIVSFNYFYSRNYYLPYQTFQLNDWIQYILSNGLLHIFVFNIIIYSLERLFS